MSSMCGCDAKEKHPHRGKCNKSMCLNSRNPGSSRSFSRNHHAADDGADTVYRLTTCGKMRQLPYFRPLSIRPVFISAARQRRVV